MVFAKQEHSLGIRQACKLFTLSTSVYYYRKKTKSEDGVIRQKLTDLFEVHRRWGFWMAFYYLRKRGHWWNHKRVYRVYTESKFNLRRKSKKRLPARIKQPLLQPLLANETWSMDFMEDRLQNSLKFRSFNVLDDFGRECLNITLGTSMTSKRVIRELTELISWRSTPNRIRVDNGPEFIAHAMKKWCEDMGIDLHFIQPGKPSQNGYVERFNRTYREEILDAYQFHDLEQANTFTQAWIDVYNHERPHKSLQYLTPVEFLEKRGNIHWPDPQNPCPPRMKDCNYDFKSLVLNVAD